MKRALFILFTLSQVNFSVLAQEVNWARHFDPEGNWNAFLPAITTQGEFTYALGYSRSSIAIDDPSTNEMLERGFFMVKLDADGNTVWKQNITTDNPNQFLTSMRIAVGAGGKAYIAGHMAGEVTFPGVDGPVEVNMRDYQVNDSNWGNIVLPFLARFNEDGLLEDVKILARVNPEIQTNLPIPFMDMILDGEKIYVAAKYRHSIIVSPGTSAEKTITNLSRFSTAEAFFIASYDTDLQFLGLIEIREPENSKNEIEEVVIEMAEPGIHVMTNFQGILTINHNTNPQNIYSGPQSSSGAFAGALMQFDENGDYLQHTEFLNTWPQGPGNGFNDMSTDENGNVYVAGTVRTSSIIGSGEDEVVFTAAAVNRPVLIKFDSDYKYQWLRTFHGASPVGVASPGGEGKFVKCLDGDCLFGGDTGSNFRIYDYENTEVLYEGDQNWAPYLMRFDRNGNLENFLVMEVKNNFPQLPINGRTTLDAFYTSSDTNIIAAGSFAGELIIGQGANAVTLTANKQSTAFDSDLFVTSLDLSFFDPPLVRLSLDNATITENGGASTITATLDQASNREVTINLELSGTAAGTGTDYQLSNTAITVVTGELTGTAKVTAIDDAIDEMDETVIIAVSEVTNGIEDGEQQLEVIITDDDSPPTLSLALDKSQISEAGEFSVLTATLSAPSGLDVSAELNLSGSATTSDYSLSSGTIMIPAGNLDESVTLSSIDDETDEENETVVISVGEASNATFDGNTVSLEIIDDDEIVVSIDEDRLASKLKLRPNPAQSLLHIDLPASSTPWTQVAIANSNGISVLTAIPLAGEKQMTLDISQLRSGVYILLVQNEEVLLRKKVMIAR